MATDENIPIEGPILDICIDGERIYTSPMAGGIWYSELPTMPNFVSEADKIALTIAPNPASAFITISASENLQDAKLTVYNLQGKVCYNSQMQGTCHEIPTCCFPSGIYFVKVAGNKTTIVRKVAILH